MNDATKLLLINMLVLVFFFRKKEENTQQEALDFSYAKNCLDTMQNLLDTVHIGEIDGT